MSAAVTMERCDDVAVIALDDGKANALSPDVIAAINSFLDEVDAPGSTYRAVAICGRGGMFSGGFDLGVMRGGDIGAVVALVTSGGDLVGRLFRSPRPVVSACTGHAIAAGALVLLGSHLRVGAAGAFRIGLIETAIGMVLPDWAVTMAEVRLAPNHVQRAVVEAKVFDPAEAAAAGFLDVVVDPGEVVRIAVEEAARLGALDPTAYAGNAAKLRGPGLARFDAAIARDR